MNQLLDRDQRRRTGRVDHVSRSAEIEPVRRAAGREIGNRGRDAIGRVLGQLRTQLVLDRRQTVGAEFRKPRGQHPAHPRNDLGIHRDFELPIRAMAAAADDQIGPPAHRSVGQDAGIGQGLIDDVQNQKLVGISFRDQFRNDAVTSRIDPQLSRQKSTTRAGDERSVIGRQMVIVAEVPASRRDVGDGVRTPCRRCYAQNWPKSSAPGKTPAIPTIATSCAWNPNLCRYSWMLDRFAGGHALQPDLLYLPGGTVMITSSARGDAKRADFRQQQPHALGRRNQVDVAAADRSREGCIAETIPASQGPQLIATTRPGHDWSSCWASLFKYSLAAL